MSEYKDIIRIAASEDGDFMPIISAGIATASDVDVSKIGDGEIPLLPLRGTVLFPLVITPVSASRTKSIKLIKDAFRDKKLIGVVAQMTDADDPTFEDMFREGTYARVVEMFTMNDDSIMAVLQGIERFDLVEFRSVLQNGFKCRRLQEIA